VCDSEAVTRVTFSSFIPLLPFYEYPFKRCLHRTFALTHAHGARYRYRWVWLSRANVSSVTERVHSSVQLAQRLLRFRVLAHADHVRDPHEPQRFSPRLRQQELLVLAKAGCCISNHCSTNIIVSNTRSDYRCSDNVVANNGHTNHGAAHNSTANHGTAHDNAAHH
jgi:hypothetical protein